MEAVEKRAPNGEAVERAVARCADIILAACPWDRVLKAEKPDGALLVTAREGGFRAWIRCDGSVAWCVEGRAPIEADEPIEVTPWEDW